MTTPASPLDETPWHAAIRKHLGPYLASPEGKRSVFKACLDAVAEDERHRLIHGDDRGYPMPANGLAIRLVEIDALDGDPIDGVRSGIELDPDRKPVAYTIAPAEPAPPRGGHTELTIARFVHEDARIRGGGELPAVWAAYS